MASNAQFHRFERFELSKKIIKKQSEKVAKHFKFRLQLRKIYRDLFEEHLKLKEKMPLHNKTGNMPWEISILGTASMMPGTYRNVSAGMLSLSGRTRILFDCGEGTLAQIHLQFGELTEAVLIDLEMVIISHIHGDHFFGVFKLLEERQRALDKWGVRGRPLHLILPGNSIPYFMSYLQLIHKFDVNVLSIKDLRQSEKSVLEFDYDDNVTFKEVSENDDYVSQHQPHRSNLLRYINPEEQSSMASFRQHYPAASTEAALIEFCHQNDIKKLLFPRVMHCPDSFGIVVETGAGKFVYSGDCRPSMELARAGRKASVLIHEATFEDGAEMEHMAKMKQHSTISEALKVAILMEAGHLILTHFSQRYCISSYMDKAPAKQNDCCLSVKKNNPLYLKYFLEKSVLASDFLTINPGNLEHISTFNFVLNQAFLGSISGFKKKLPSNGNS